MNYIPQIAKMLGVEIGERFNVVNNDAVYFFDCYFSDDAFVFGPAQKATGYSNYDVLARVLQGAWQIKTRPWKPKEGDTYFRPNFGTRFKPDYCEFTWSGCRDEEYAYELGMVCRTAEEAIAKAKKMLAAAQEVNVNDD